MLSLRLCRWALFVWILVGSLGLATQTHGAVHALLIGVGDYKESKVSDLLGPPNDVALIKKVLTDRFDVPPANIKVILNPTHTATEQAFADLTARVQPNDQVYVHYSGHGSWTVAPPAAAGEVAERRGQDQTWVVHGSRSDRREGKDAMDVLDKELALWLDPLYKLTPDVVVVSDSCHSATVTRDDQHGVRSVDGSRQPHPLRATIKRVPEPTAGLRIGAARDFESAVELDPRVNGRCSTKSDCYGVFTWHWAKALQSSRPGESWGDVFNRATAAMTATPGVMQRPQMEGVANRAVFAGQFAPLSALVPVAEVRPDGAVILGAGLLSGLTVGSEFEGMAIQPDAAPRIQITSATAGTAQAKLLSGKVKAGEVVREAKHQYTERPIRLFVGGPQVADVDAVLAKQLSQAIDEARKFSLQGFELVPQREEADWRLEILRPKPGTQASITALPEGMACKSGSCEAPELWVVSPLGQLMDLKMRFSMANPQAEMPRLLSNLALFAHAREVRAIGAQGNETPLQIQVSVLRPPAGDTASCLVGVKENSGWQRSAPVPLNNLNSQDVRFRDCLAFTLVNRDPAKTWYGYILGVDPNFSVQPVWPKAGRMEDEARIEPGRTYAVTDSLYRLSDPGRETLLFVASETPAPVASLARSGMRNATTRGDRSPLARLLTASTLTRGPESKMDNWGALSLEIDVHGPTQ